MKTFFERKATAGSAAVSVAMSRKSEYGNPLHGDVRPPEEAFGSKGPMKRMVGPGANATGKSNLPPRTDIRMMSRRA